MAKRRKGKIAQRARFKKAARICSKVAKKRKGSYRKCMSKELSK